MTGRWIYAPIEPASPVGDTFRVTHEIERWGVPVALIGHGDSPLPHGSTFEVYLATDPPLFVSSFSDGYLGLGARARTDGVPVDHSAGWTTAPAKAGDDPASVSAWVRQTLGSPVEPPGPDREPLTFELGLPDSGLQRRRFSRPDPAGVLFAADRVASTASEPDAVVTWLETLRRELVDPLIEANQGPGVSLGFNPDRQGGVPYGLGATIVTETMSGRWGRTKPDDRGWRALGRRIGRREIRSLHVALQPIDGRGWSSRQRGDVDISLVLDEHDYRVDGARPGSILTIRVCDFLADGIGQPEAQHRVVDVGLAWVRAFGAESGFAAWSRERSSRRGLGTPSPWEREHDWYWERPDTTTFVRGARWGTLVPSQLLPRVDVERVRTPGGPAQLVDLDTPLGRATWLQLGPDARTIAPVDLQRLEQGLAPVLPPIPLPPDVSTHSS